jgi:hypothetical protein
MMPYRYFKKIHPSWPAKLGDVVGKLVKLERDITTRGKRTFTAGTKMYVTHVYRGALELDFDPKGMGMVRQVPPEDVTLVR